MPTTAATPKENPKGISITTIKKFDTIAYAPSALIEICDANKVNASKHHHSAASIRAANMLMERYSFIAGTSVNTSRVNLNIGKRSSFGSA